MWYISIGEFVKKFMDKEDGGFQKEVFSEIQGVYDITVSGDRVGIPNRQVIMLSCAGSKQQVMEFAELCFGHPAELDASSKWEIHPSGVRVVALDAEASLRFFKNFFRQLQERIPPPPEKLLEATESEA